ncbi:MAG TPA: serine hydrolase [Actinomycetota bacterium]|nr:serine hydrolase [Actinomycetota bacterium]
MASEMELTNTLAGRRVAWILSRAGEAVNASDVEEHFAPSFLQHINADQVIGFIAQMGQLKGGDVDRINEESDREIGVVIVIEGETARISAQVEPDPPHRLTSLRIRTGPTLLDAIDSARPTTAPLAEWLETANETEDGGLIAGGVVTGAMRGDEEAVFSFGDASADQIFEIGSITKAFTGILLAEMDEQGEVSLDAPVARYLPSGIRVPSQGERGITLVDLATHGSGLPRTPAVMRASDTRRTRTPILRSRTSTPRWSRQGWSCPSDPDRSTRTSASVCSDTSWPWLQTHLSAI